MNRLPFQVRSLPGVVEIDVLGAVTEAMNITCCTVKRPLCNGETERIALTRVTGEGGNSLLFLCAATDEFPQYFTSDEAAIEAELAERYGDAIGHPCRACFIHVDGDNVDDNEFALRAMIVFAAHAWDLRFLSEVIRTFRVPLAQSLRSLLNRPH